jgi:DNA-binding CsgD family transcriptional regulator
MTAPDIDRLLADEFARAAPPKRLPALGALSRDFRQVGDDHYRMDLPEIGVSLDIDRLRRERNELVGELCVRCDLPGARTVGGSLSIADLNVSSARARQERAKLLAARANTRDQLDWTGLVEEFAQRVLAADRAGQPAIDLRAVDPPDADDTLRVEGLPLPRRHPTVLFGDGGACKSYLALWLAGRAVEMGMSVALVDWELGAEDHRERLGRLFPDGMPRIIYCRCERPLVQEVDRLRRIMREHDVQYAVYDSVAFAADGPPESAETAARYFRAVRQIGVGSLHIAHVTKSETGDQRPFGSIFWHNGARSTWYAKLAESSVGTDSLDVGLFPRKANLGRLAAPVGYRIVFDGERTVIRRSNVADEPELAAKLTVAQRIAHLLRRGAMTVTDIAAELGVEPNTITQTVNRNIRKGRLFMVLGGDQTNRRIGLLERDTCHDTPGSVT